jgi:hypothetical protein
MSCLKSSTRLRLLGGGRIRVHWVPGVSPRSVRISTDQYGSVRISTDQYGSVRISTDQYGLEGIIVQPVMLWARVAPPALNSLI